MTKGTKHATRCSSEWAGNVAAAGHGLLAGWRPNFRRRPWGLSHSPTCSTFPTTLTLPAAALDVMHVLHAAPPPRPPAPCPRNSTMADATQAGEVPADAVVETKQPTWRMPSPMPSMLSFYDTFYPLRMYNSLTRSKVRRGGLSASGVPVPSPALPACCTAGAIHPQERQGGVLVHVRAHSV